MRENEAEAHLQLLGYGLGELFARGLCWVLCLGLEYDDAVRLHTSVVAAIRQSCDSG